MADLTFIIPYADEHAGIMERARQSVLAQTVSCEAICIHDARREGVSKMRNEGVRKATTSLVAFLDADDTLLPDYAEKMIAYWQPGRYVFCDDIRNGSPRPRGDCPKVWTGERHVVTCVISREDFWRVGGFDEHIQKAEDIEFWLRCTERGVCGIHCPYPLMHYTKEHSVQRKGNQQVGYKVGQWLMNIRYKEIKTLGCCGDDTPIEFPVLGEQREGDVVVRCMWAGNHSHVGRVSGRAYVRNGNGKRAWMDPRDAAADPKSYAIVQEDIFGEAESQSEDSDHPAETKAILPPKQRRKRA